MGVDHLAPQIHEILSAPDTDLTTVSAKHVRKQLLERDPHISLEYIKENKDAIDVLIGSIFESLNNPDAGVHIEPAHTVNGNGKRKRGDHGEDEENAQDSEGEDEQEEQSPSPKKPAPKKPAPKKQGKTKSSRLTDEEYARQLSSELNQRPSRSGRRGNGSSKKDPSRTPKKARKSRAEIDDDSEQEAADGSSPKRKSTKPAKKNGSGAKGGFAKEFALSEPLAAVLDVPQLSRPQVVKRLWQYIRANELQNPKNKKEIICDDALRAVFNSDKIDMFGMNKTLGQHLYELEL